MSKSTPSLLALLGLVAVAGYQNRGKISEMLSNARQRSPGSRPDAAEAGGLLSEIGNLFGGGKSAGTLSAGLSDLLDRFRESGRATTAESWVSTAPNMPVDLAELEAAIGPDTLDELGRKTGLARNELLLRLNAALPEVVDRFTPEGRVPTETEARSFD